MKKDRGGLTASSQWQALWQHQQELKSARLALLFEQDPLRFDTFSFQLEELSIDFSKNLLTEKTLDLLLKLAHSRQLFGWIEKLFQGEIVNQSENKAAWHVALRHSQPKPQIKAQLEKIEKFILELNNTHITDIVHVGVGGSDLGPRLFVNACKKQSQFGIHFVSCLDGEKTLDLISKLNPKTTLVIIASKSFSTIDF